MRVKLSTFPAAAMLLVGIVILPAAHGQGPDADGGYDRDAALQRSQAAIGTRLGDYTFTDRDGGQIRLTDYAGQPLLISLIYTSCYHTCPMTTRHLARQVVKAREALGEDSFAVATIGFDSRLDTPEAMRAFARDQGVAMSGWKFLSGSAETLEQLIDDLGFVYFPSPRGYDHVVMVTIIDRNNSIYSQVYGEVFELPWLVEPLKELVFNRPQSAGHPIAGLLDRIRIFCTVYDPNSGRYRTDYSLFIQIGVGLVVVLSIIAYLLTEGRRARQKR